MAELIVPDYIEQAKARPLRVLRTVHDVAGAHATFSTDSGESREEPCAVFFVETTVPDGDGFETFDLVVRLADLGGLSSAIVAAGCEVGALIAGYDDPEEGR